MRWNRGWYSSGSRSLGSTSNLSKVDPYVTNPGRLFANLRVVAGVRDAGVAVAEQAAAMWRRRWWWRRALRWRRRRPHRHAALPTDAPRDVALGVGRGLVAGGAALEAAGVARDPGPGVAPGGSAALAAAGCGGGGLGAAGAARPVVAAEVGAVKRQARGVCRVLVQPFWCSPVRWFHTSGTCRRR